MDATTSTSDVSAEVREVWIRTGMRLKSVRLKRGLGLRAAADGIGIDKNTLMKFERGDMVRPVIFERICRFYGFEPSDPTKRRFVSDRYEDATVFRPEKGIWHVVLTQKEEQGRITNEAIQSSGERMRLGRIGRAARFIQPMDTRIPGGVSTSVRMELWRPATLENGPVGEYYIYVLKGRLAVTSHELNAILDEGGSVCFRNEIPKTFGPAEPPGLHGEPTEILVVEII